MISEINYNINLFISLTIKNQFKSFLFISRYSMHFTINQPLINTFSVIYI